MSKCKTPGPLIADCQSQTEQPELRETTQLDLGTKISRIRNSKPTIKLTMNLRLREMRGQGAGSPWRLRQWGRDQVEATEFYSVVT